MSDSTQGARKVGFGSPPVEHQFKKGQSGNPAGRPVREARSLLPRQLRRDILAAGEMPTKIRSAAGEKTVTVYEAVLMRLVQKALSGHAPSMHRFLDLFEKAVGEHHAASGKRFDFLEMVEQDQIENPTPRENANNYQRFVNSLRDETRRF